MDEFFAAGPDRGVKGTNKQGGVYEADEDGEARRRRRRRMLQHQIQPQSQIRQPNKQLFSLPNLTTCLSTLSFDGSLYAPPGSTIPSEIGLLTLLLDVVVFLQQCVDGDNSVIPLLSLSSVLGIYIDCGDTTCACCRSGGVGVPCV